MYLKQGTNISPGTLVNVRLMNSVRLIRCPRFDSEANLQIFHSLVSELGEAVYLFQSRL